MVRFNMLSSSLLEAKNQLWVYYLVLRFCYFEYDSGFTMFLRVCSCLLLLTESFLGWYRGAVFTAGWIPSLVSEFGLSGSVPPSVSSRSGFHPPITVVLPCFGVCICSGFVAKCSGFICVNLKWIVLVSESGPAALGCSVHSVGPIFISNICSAARWWVFKGPGQFLIVISYRARACVVMLPFGWPTSECFKWWTEGPTPIGLKIGWNGALGYTVNLGWSKSLGGLHLVQNRVRRPNYGYFDLFVMSLYSLARKDINPTLIVIYSLSRVYMVSLVTPQSLFWVLCWLDSSGGMPLVKYV